MVKLNINEVKLQTVVLDKNDVLLCIRQSGSSTGII